MRLLQAANSLTASPDHHASLPFPLHCLLAGGFFFGYTLSKAMGMPERAARTNSIEVCAR